MRLPVSVEPRPGEAWWGYQQRVAAMLMVPEARLEVTSGGVAYPRHLDAFAAYYNLAPALAASLHLQSLAGLAFPAATPGWERRPGHCWLRRPRRCPACEVVLLSWHLPWICTCLHHGLYLGTEPSSWEPAPTAAVRRTLRLTRLLAEPPSRAMGYRCSASEAISSWVDALALAQPVPPHGSEDQAAQRIDRLLEMVQPLVLARSPRRAADIAQQWLQARPPGSRTRFLSRVSSPQLRRVLYLR